MTHTELAAALDELSLTRAWLTERSSLMQKGRGGMGSHKHGISGHAGKSPRQRLMERVEAEKNERKARPSTTVYASVKDAFSQKPKG